MAMSTFAAALLVLAAPARADSLEKKLEAWHLPPGPFAGFSLDEEKRYEAGGLVTEEISAKAPGGERRATIVVTSGPDEKALEALLRARRDVLTDQFETKNPGDGTLRQKRCAPPKMEVGVRAAFTVPATGSLRFGLCDNKGAKYMAVAVFAPCPGRAYEIYYYAPPAADLRKVRAKLLHFSCEQKEAP